MRRVTGEFDTGAPQGGVLGSLLFTLHSQSSRELFSEVRRRLHHPPPNPRTAEQLLSSGRETPPLTPQHVNSVCSCIVVFVFRGVVLKRVQTPSLACVPCVTICVSTALFAFNHTFIPQLTVKEVTSAFSLCKLKMSKKTNPKKTKQKQSIKVSRQREDIQSFPQTERVRNEARRYRERFQIPGRFIQFG